MNIIFGTHIHETPRLGLFLDSVPHSSFVRSYAVHAEGHLPKYLPKPFERIGWNVKISSEVIPGSKSDKPCVNDIFTALADCNPNGLFMFTNSDVEFAGDCLDSIKHYWKRDETKAIALYRRDYSPYNSSTMLHGQDGFVVDSRFWLKHAAKFSDIPNILGEPGWDNAFTSTFMDLAGKENVLHLRDLLHHREHSRKWDHQSYEWTNYLADKWDSCPSKRTWETFAICQIQ